MTRPVRITALLLFIGAALGIAAFVLLTPTGQAVIADPHRFGQDARGFVGRHPVISPLVFFGAYLLLAIALLPVWWLQVLGGYAFGLYYGTTCAVLSAALTSVVIVTLSRALGSDALREKAEARLSRLHGLMTRLGHNGLLTVMLVRLTHIAPFALSNHLFALVPIHRRDVFFGTLLGGIPSIALYVALGADRSLMRSGTFWIILAALNVLPLLPSALKLIRRR